MKRASNILLKLIILLAVIAVGLNFPVHAQPASQWAADQKVPGYLDDTFTPYLVADQNRTVHAFASQWIDDGERRLAIVYRKWTLAGGWTRPVDVLLATSGSATFLGAFLDPSGILHVIFANGESRNASIYYANAPAELADSALVWSVPTKIGIGISGVNSASLVGDDQGNLIIIYSGNIDGSGVYALHSSDSGQRWTDPLPVFLTPDEGLVPYSLRLFVSPEKQFRASWNVVTSLGVDKSLYFSSYDIASAQWLKPSELDNRIDLPDYFGPSFPSIVDNGEEIVIFFNGGKPSTGRPVQRVAVSINGGQTWSDPVVPFPDHVGRSGENSLVLDGAGRPHALFIQRIESTTADGEYTIIGGVWHSVLESGSWTSPDRFVTTYAPHDVRSVVVQGNILLTVWREDPGVGEHGIWYTYSRLDVPESPTSLAPSILPTLDSALTEPTIVVQAPTSPVLSDTQREILEGNTNPASPFVAGILPVFIVLAGVIVMVLVLRRRQ